MLYKKKDDDSLVILKEINMHDLTAAERQLALNEVSACLRLGYRMHVTDIHPFTGNSSVDSHIKRTFKERVIKKWRKKTATINKSL